MSKKSVKTDELKTDTEITRSPKSANRRHPFFKTLWILLMTFLVVVTYGVYENLSSCSMKMPHKKVEKPVIPTADVIPVKVETTTFKMPEVLLKNPDTPKSVLFNADGAEDTLTPAEMETDGVEDKDLEVLSEPVAEEKASEESKGEQKSESVAEKIPAKDETVVPQVPADTEPYTLLDAVAFRDNFVNGRPCSADLKKLMMSKDRNLVAQEAINSVSFVCLKDDNGFNRLTRVFEAAKRQAISRYYRNQSPKWFGYTASVVARFITIHKIKPTGNSDRDIMDLAHTALQNRHLPEAVQQIRTLPDNFQVYFEDFLALSESYMHAMRMLDNLVMSFDKGN